MGSRCRYVCKTWYKFRLVCKLWYSILNQNGSTTISRRGKLRQAAEFLPNCRFQSLHLNFVFNPYIKEELILEDMPAIVWQEVGTKIHTLEFCHVHLGSKVMKNVILHCSNLRTLTVKLEAFNLDSAFCLPETLENLNVVRKNLQTLEIVIDMVYRNGWLSAYIAFDFETWYRIFAALIRIFPSVIHFCSSGARGFDSDGWRKLFKCSFTKDSKEIEDKSSLAKCLTYSLSDDVDDWRRAIEALNTSKLRYSYELLIY